MIQKLQNGVLLTSVYIKSIQAWNSTHRRESQAHPLALSQNVSLVISGACGVQSSGGNATRQNFGAGFKNSIATSLFPSGARLTRTTRQGCSSDVSGFCKMTVWPWRTPNSSTISAPCALTTEVWVCSRAIFLSGPGAMTATGILRYTRWLRLRSWAGPGFGGSRDMTVRKQSASPILLRQEVESTAVRRSHAAVCLRRDHEIRATRIIY